MEIRFAGAISLPDFQRAQAVDGRTRLTWLILTGLVGLLVLLQLFTLLSEPFTATTLLTLFPLLLATVFFWGFVRWQIRSTWKKNQAMFSAISGVITENTVQYNTGQSESTMRWELFQKHKSAPDMILLYQTTQAFNVFPRHFFTSDADWSAFTRLVEEKLAKQ
jgi:hypothetical protein